MDTLKNFDWNRTNQLNISQVVIAFLLPSLFACIGFRYVLPTWIAQGFPKILAWPIIAATMLLVFVIIGFFLVKKEAKQLGVSLKERLLFKKISAKQWGISIGILFVGLLFSAGLSGTVVLFQQLPGLAIPGYMPFWLNPAIDPMQTFLGVLSPG